MNDRPLYPTGAVLRPAGTTVPTGCAATQPAARDIQVGGDHYKTVAVQPWDVVDTWPRDQRIGFYRGNALKYVMRMGTKDEEAGEAGKAYHYLQKLTEVLGEQA